MRVHALSIVSLAAVLLAADASGVTAQQPVPGVASETPSLPDDTVLAALADRRTNGTLLVVLKESTVRRGVNAAGAPLPVQARYGAEAAILRDVPGLQRLRGVQHVRTWRTAGGVRVDTAHRTFIVVSGTFNRVTLQALRAHPNVWFIEPNWSNIVIRGRPAHRSPHPARSPALLEQGPFAIDTMRARAAWSSGYTGQGVSVGIVDTGADGYLGNHPDISTDPNTNWQSFNATWGWYSDDSCTDSSAVCWWEGPYHGTGVFGAVAAAQNGQSSLGIAPAPVPALATARAVYINTAGQTAGGEQADLADGVNSVNDMQGYYPSHPRVGVMSIGYATDDTASYRVLREAFIRSANTGKMLWFAAADETGSGVVGIPGAYPEVVAVGVLEQNLARMTRADATSPIHTKIEFVAPVGDSWVSWNRHDQQNNALYPGYISSVTGTSFAAPIVAGIARIAWARNPSWTANTLRNNMRTYARDLGPAGKDNTFGYGMPDAVCLLNLTSPCRP